eukprot:1045002-Prymnesium_polylepis.2
MLDLRLHVGHLVLHRGQCLRTLVLCPLQPVEHMLQRVRVLKRLQRLSLHRRDTPLDLRQRLRARGILPTLLRRVSRLLLQLPQLVSELLQLELAPQRAVPQSGMHQPQRHLVLDRRRELLLGGVGGVRHCWLRRVVEPRQIVVNDCRCHLARLLALDRCVPQILHLLA